MKYLQTCLTLLTIFVIASMFLGPVDSSNPPPEPDDAHVDSFKEWMDQWRIDNMNPAAEDVEDAYDNFSGLVGDYRDAINGVGGVAFDAVSGAAQTTWLGLVTSLYNVSKEGARAIANTQTLQSAVELAASHHSTYLYNYNELYDRHGTIDAGTVATQVLQEISQHGGILVSASTMMEAYWKYYYIVEDYNAKVGKWNEYAPSQAKNKRFTTVPSKAEFDKFLCFGGCNYEHDILDYARDNHQIDCGTAENVDEVVRRRRGNIYDERRILRDRRIEEGCGRPYYVCNLDDKATHEPQTCTQWVWEPPDYYGGPLNKSMCGIRFRKCLGKTFDHNPYVIGENVHSTDSSTEETASNLDPPAMHLCNAHEEWQSGIHSAAACGLVGHFVCDSQNHSSSYTCNVPPCSNRVVPYCLALCPESSSHGSTTITAAPTPTPTPAPTPESTPILVSCGGNGWTGCTEQVSSENDHYVSSCSNCSNSYWTCRPVHGAVKHETPRTCARNRCDNTFTLCSRPPCDVNSEWKCQ